MTIINDLSVAGNAEKLYEAVKATHIDVLINNAGFGDFSLPWDVNLTKAINMVDLNVRALSILSLLYIADYKDKEATLINVSSIGGYSVFDISAIYCGTKFFVSSFTEGLDSALRRQNKPMRVKIIAPGATESEFNTQASERAGIVGNALFTLDVFITADQLADYTYQLFESDKVLGIVNGEKQLELLDAVYPQASLS